jgi:hypothetical protein
MVKVFGHHRAHLVLDGHPDGHHQRQPTYLVNAPADILGFPVVKLAIKRPAWLQRQEIVRFANFHQFVDQTFDFSFALGIERANLGLAN